MNEGRLTIEDAGQTADLIDSEGRVSRDIFCTGCDYNLRMTAADQSCPECGESVATTLANPLAILPTMWRRGLFRGSVLIAVGIFARLFLIFLGFITPTVGSLPVAMIALVVVFSVWLNLGIWLFATPLTGANVPPDRLHGLCVFSRVLAVLEYCILSSLFLAIYHDAALLTYILIILWGVAAAALCICITAILDNRTELASPRSNTGIYYVAMAVALLFPISTTLMFTLQTSGTALLIAASAGLMGHVIYAPLLLDFAYSIRGRRSHD